MWTLEALYVFLSLIQSLALLVAWPLTRRWLRLSIIFIAKAFIALGDALHDRCMNHMLIDDEFFLVCIRMDSIDFC